MNRRALTEEESAEAHRLQNAWQTYRASRLGTTQAWLAAESGLGTQGAVNQYLRGVIPLNLQALLAICKVIGADPRSISPRLMEAVDQVAESSSGSTTAKASASMPFDENISLAPIGPLRPIPVISAVQAGALRDMENPYEPGDGYAVEYTDDTKLSRWAFSLDIDGDSMLPDFKPGDRVIVDPDLSPNPGDFVVARNGSNQATFKKYRPRGIDANGNMIFELVPLNDDYPTMRSDTEHLIVIGVATEHRKKFRRH